jgi:hypothetical protein
MYPPIQNDLSDRDKPDRQGPPSGLFHRSAHSISSALRSRHAAAVEADPPTTIPTEAVFLDGVLGCPATSTPVITALKPSIMGGEPTLANRGLHKEFLLVYVPFNLAWSVI